MERHRGHLEGHSGGHEREAHGQPGSQRTAGNHPGERQSHSIYTCRAGDAPDVGKAEQQDRARERPEQEVLDRALGGVRVAAGEAGEDVAGQNHQLQAHEEEKQVGGTGDQHRPSDGEEQHGGEFRER